MKAPIRRRLAVAALSTLLVPLHTGAAEVNPLSDSLSDRIAIRQQLRRYEQALNTADTNAVMQLYAADAVFMPQHSSPSIGRPAVRRAYERVFQAIRLNIHFDIDEVQTLGPGWAYARTRSSGTAQLQGSALPAGPEANQELFLLHREDDGVWRFARYIFSTTQAPKAP